MTLEELFSDIKNEKLKEALITYYEFKNRQEELTEREAERFENCRKVLVKLAVTAPDDWSDHQATRQDILETES
ncbi:TPA: hypothetical protein I7264_25975 [Vibrio parahaemolyticus]|uniref:hypothetical protein n=1 Tax=Vibrio harveyi group TaxID=717610 RepID=UPI0003591956|nr:MULTISPECIES: hypothetical protein [Vibrio harveyi group]AGQ92266.1 hypothetical protein M634_10970 [Vibrio parahaemolyticus O1:Kuk str. FDA_R31]EGQ7814874.1 hypothetical protein [Vibrio parahaemolyticus]EGQ7873377.1 hypothetical protein [Vibrio parahaemolyticus]EGQ8808819.1 hypothetical protein [Vibrio parahaemolyticus]EGQ8893111.1 hypothetical protein [Vibrio parahaemolyticus]